MSEEWKVGDRLVPIINDDTIDKFMGSVFKVCYAYDYSNYENIDAEKRALEAKIDELEDQVESIEAENRGLRENLYVLTEGKFFD